MKPETILQVVDVRKLTLYVILVGGSVGAAHFAGMFIIVPSVFWPHLGLQTPLMVILQFTAFLVVALLPFRAVQWATVRMFALDGEARIIGELRRAVAFFVQLFAGMLASAIFATLYLRMDLAQIGLSWMAVACVSLVTLLASDKLLSIYFDIRDGLKPGAEEMSIILRATKTATIILLLASFACGWIHMGQRLHGNFVQASDTPHRAKLIWATAYGEFFADYDGGPFDLKKTVTWYFVPWNGKPRRVTNTIDLLMRDSLRELLRIGVEPMER